MAKKLKLIPRNLRNATLLAWVGVMHDLRTKRKWTLGKLADRAGLARHSLYLLESHERDPRGDTMIRVSHALGLPTSATVAMAEERVALWPDRCESCNYCCIERGRLTWWNPTRGCLRSRR